MIIDKIYRNLDNKNLGKIQTCVPIDGGLESNNYLLQTDIGKYILKFYHKTSVNEINFEHSILKKLRTLGNYFPIPVIEFLVIEDIPCSIYSFLEGRSLQLMDITVQNLDAIASLLAKMHLHLQEFKPAGSRERFSVFDIRFLDAFKSVYTDEENDLINSGKEWLEMNLLGLNNHSLQKSIIHEDLEMENIFIDKKNAIKFIDFGEAHYAEVVSDIATTIKELILNNHGLDLSLINAFISKYQLSNQELKDQDLELIFPLSIRRTLFMLSYFLHKKAQQPSEELENKIFVEKTTLKMLLSTKDRF